MSDSACGVPRLVSRPRKKPTETLIGTSNGSVPDRCLINSDAPRDASSPERRGRGRQFGIARA